jgi:hypothetical protein
MRLNTAGLMPGRDTLLAEAASGEAVRALAKKHLEFRQLLGLLPAIVVFRKNPRVRRDAVFLDPIDQ